jgi:hypothetical protein
MIIKQSCFLNMLTVKYFSPKLALKLAKSSDFSLKAGGSTKALQQLGFSLDPWGVEVFIFFALHI